MRTFSFHMPHLKRPGRVAASGAGHRHEPTVQRLRRFEGAVDYVVIAGVLILAAAMVWGLLTASGDAPWF